MIQFRKIWIKRKYRFLALLFLAILAFYFSGNFLYSQIFKVVPDTAYYFMPTLDFKAKENRILIFSPHPDDEILAAAGYIQSAIEQGLELKIILVTDGNRRGQGEKRQNQFQKATEHLGVKQENLVFLEYNDGYLKNEKDSDLDLVFKKQIDQFKPDVIIYPSSFDQNLDHRLIGLSLERIFNNFRGIKKLAYLVHFKGFPFPRKLKMDHFLMPPANLFFSCQWTKFALTNNQVQKKLEALSNYQIFLSYPIEKGYLLSFVRKNEIFCQE